MERREKIFDIDSLMHRMKTISQRVFLSSSKEKMPLPEGQGRVLHCLWHRPNVTLKELADLLHIRPSSLSELITKLEKGGFIVRERNPEDKRTVRVNLTVAGRGFFQRYRGEHEKKVEEMLSTLSDSDIEDIYKAFKKLVDHCEENAKRIK